MPTYKVLLGPIATDTVFQTGDTIELSERDAQSLLDLKVIEVIEPVESTSNTSTNTSTKAETKPKGTKSEPEA